MNKGSESCEPIFRRSPAGTAFPAIERGFAVEQAEFRGKCFDVAIADCGRSLLHEHSGPQHFGCFPQAEPFQVLIRRHPERILKIPVHIVNVDLEPSGDLRHGDFFFDPLLQKVTDFGDIRRAGLDLNGG